MKKLTFLFLILCFGSFAQTTTPQVINSAGGSGSVSSGTNTIDIFYNIGEPMITTITNGSNILTQGFLQPDIVGIIGLNLTAFSSNESCFEKKDGKINLVLNSKPYDTCYVVYFWTPSSLCPGTNYDCNMVDSLAPGIYSVTVKAFNDHDNVNGIAVDSVGFSFTITANPDPCQIQIFTSFTPNGDGINDTWVIEDIDQFPNNTVTIYNRWGNKLASYTNYDNKNNAWKGETPNGSTVTNGTYFYVIELNNGTGYKKGWVEVTGK